MDRYSTQAEIDFESAHFHAFLADVAAHIARRPNELLSFEAVRSSIVTTGSSYKGIQTVPVDQIVGSATNRYNDFNRAFLPAQRRTKPRWKRIDAARMAGETLPPVQLYKLGDVYFVRDGHHRVSVARENGQEEIEAEVIEVRTRLPLNGMKKRLRGEELEIIGEYSSFLEQTQLDRIRPGADLRFSQPGGYARLLEHIVVHRYYMGLNLNRDVSWEEAVGDWYDQIYLPIVLSIRERSILSDFPKRTEADLYLWIIDHHYYLQQQHPTGLDDAAEDYRLNYSPRLSRKLGRILRGLVLQWHGKPEEPVSPSEELAKADG